MYAVIRSGGKQYRVAPGDTIKVETLAGKVGGKVTFEDVLAVRTDDEKMLAGKDLSGATVTAKIVEHGRHAKEMVMKYKKTNQYKITRGHRQNYTAVEVSEINL